MKPVNAYSIDNLLFMWLRGHFAFVASWIENGENVCRYRLQCLYIYIFLITSKIALCHENILQRKRKKNNWKKNTKTGMRLRLNIKIS